MHPDRPSPPLPLPSAARGGAAFLYVLPCHGEDLLKLGFSRDPLARMQALHPRFYEFFDLSRAFAVQTERVRDARALELALARRLHEHHAACPLTVRVAAGGETEWYRGARALLSEEAGVLQARGHVVLPLQPWVRERLLAAADALYAWVALLSADELDARGPLARSTPAQRRVVDVLDGYRAFDIDLDRWLPPQVLDWFRHASLRGAA